MKNRDQLRQQKQQQCEERLEAIYRQYPELQELDGRIAQKNIVMIRSGILHKNGAEQQRLQQEIAALLQEQEQLLQRLGLDAGIYKPQWDCPLCEDRGYTAPGVLCSCYQKERMDELFQRSGMPETMRGFTFDNFDCSHYDNPEDMEAKVQWCRQFAWQAAQGSCDRSLVLTGDVGRGKTHLSAAIANSVLDQGGMVLYRRAGDLFDLIRRYRFEESSAQWRELLDQLRSCDLLVLDDLGVEHTTEFVIEQLVAIIEDRNYGNKPWIINTNLSINSIKEAYTSRVSDRILERARIFKLTSKDSNRVAQARERKETM